MKKYNIVIFSICLAVLLSAAVAAQPPWGDNGHHRDRGFGGPHGGKMSANIENLRMLKLLEAVDLTEEQSTEFIPVFHGYRSDVNELRIQRDSLIEEIITMVNSNGEDNEIKPKLAELKDNRERMEARREEFLADCDTILTVPQIARLVIFQERFERDMLRALHNFRRQEGMSNRMKKQGNH